MGMFLGDIAFMIELFGFAFGLILLHHAKKDGKLLRVAGIVMIVGSILFAICTGMGVYKMRSHNWMEHMSKEMKEMKEASHSRE